MEPELTPLEKQLLEAEDRSMALFGFWIAGISGLALSAVGIVLVQSFLWLRDGIWQPFSVREAISWSGTALPSTSWRGAQKVLEWLLNCPVSGVLVALALLLVFWITKDDHKETPDALRTARGKRAAKSAHGR